MRPDSEQDYHLPCALAADYRRIATASPACGKLAAQLIALLRPAPQSMVPSAGETEAAVAVEFILRRALTLLDDGQADAAAAGIKSALKIMRDFSSSDRESAAPPASVMSAAKHVRHAHRAASVRYRATPDDTKA